MSTRQDASAQTQVIDGPTELQSTRIEMSASDDRPSPRAAAIAALYPHAAALALGGDLEGARLLHETIGRLLGDGVAVAGAEVLDLSSERRKRT